MASTSYDSSAMETSTLLRDIADFDIKGPITVRICFEDDLDETPVKTEIKTDDCQKEPPTIDNSAFIPILEPKKEAQDEASEESSSSVIVQNNLQDTVHKPEKRKADLDLQPWTEAPKKGKKDNSLHIDTNTEKDMPLNSLPPTENENLLVNSVDGAPKKIKHSVIVNGLPQNEIEKINVCITNCLATISDHMRRIMDAYNYHKLQNTPKQSFHDIKLKHFRSIFKYMCTILLPEEKNSEFIQTFLKDTVQRARKASGPNHGRTYEDYATLLCEMLMWAKRTKYQISQAVKHRNVNSVITTATENNTQSGPKQLVQVQDTQNGNTKTNYSNVSANADKVCLFASGPPGREFSINIDPVKYSELTGQDLKAETKTLQKSCVMNEPHKTESTNSHLSAVNATIESRKNIAAKSHNSHKITQETAIQAVVPQISKLATTHYLHSQQSNPSTNLMRNIPPNYTIATQQMNARAPLLQTQLNTPQKPPSQLYQQMQPQQQTSQGPHPPYGILPHLQAQFDQARYTKMQSGQDLPTPPQYVQAHLKQPQVVPSQYATSRQLQVQLTQNPQTQPQFNPAQLMQMQNMSMQFQSGHSFSQQGQKLNYDLSGNPQVQQQHTKDSQISLQQLLSEKFPSMTALLYQDASTNKPSQGRSWEFMQQQREQPNYATHQQFGSTHYLYQIQDKALPGQWHSQNLDGHNAQLSQPRPAPVQQWHQELNGIYHEGVAPQTQKGSPRTASTDSGFISPVNFNMSIDRTIPDSSQEPGTSLPLITHVTSLSEKAAFVEYGQCVVCKKSTKQMCMGCMKIYYCTYQCQSQDWSTHASYCTQQTTNYGSAQPS